jgi:type IV fimbrial biogenesis protein FimT
MGQRGASFMEIMVVLGLMGLVGAMVGESFLATADRQQSRAAVAEVAAELRAARQLAIVRREPVRVRVGSAVPALIIEPADTPGLIVRRYDYGQKGVALEGSVRTKGILFYPSGRTATPSTVTIRNAKQEEWRLTVSLLGRVSVR